MSRRTKPSEPDIHLVDVVDVAEPTEPKPYVDVPRPGGLWVSRWGEPCVVLDRSREIVPFGLGEVLDSVFDDEEVVDAEGDHISVETRCVRLLLKGRTRRQPLKMFLDWWRFDRDLPP